MPKRLLILSDLWGGSKSEWLIHYTQILETCFDIVYYDSRELAEINPSDYTDKVLHSRFVNGGIDRAVQNLIEIEKGRSTVLAFSVGGVIAWKFGIKTDKIISLTCVSSTRLRNETHKPNGELMLYFGNNDPFKPKPEWFDTTNLESEILKDKGHLMYREPDFAENLCNRIIENMKRH